MNTGDIWKISHDSPHQPELFGYRELSALKNKLVIFDSPWNIKIMFVDESCGCKTVFYRCGRVEPRLYNCCIPSWWVVEHCHHAPCPISALCHCPGLPLELLVTSHPFFNNFLIADILLQFTSGIIPLLSETSKMPSRYVKF